MSPILFLLYSAALLDLLTNPDTSTLSPNSRYAVAYHDDTYVIVVSNSFRMNCRLLEKAYDKCQQWARSFDAKFEPSKFKIIHFNRRRKRSILQQTSVVPRIDGLNKQTALVNEQKVLGVVLDKELKWKAHVNQVRQSQCCTGSTTKSA